MPAACEQLLNHYGDLARDLGQNMQLQRFFFLGTDLLYGLACEAMLKMKEMSLSYSEAFHVLEFRHGPMSMVNEQTLMVGLLSDQAQQHEGAVIREMQARGAQALVIGNGLAEYSDGAAVVELGADVPVWGRTVLYLPVLQLLAYHRALANGQNPDKPANLDAVVSLDNL